MLVSPLVVGLLVVALVLVFFAIGAYSRSGLGLAMGFVSEQVVAPSS